MKLSNTLGGSTPDDVWTQWFEEERGKEINGTSDDQDEDEED